MTELNTYCLIETQTLETADDTVQHDVMQRWFQLPAEDLTTATILALCWCHGFVNAYSELDIKSSATIKTITRSPYPPTPEVYFMPFGNVGLEIDDEGKKEEQQ